MTKKVSVTSLEHLAELVEKDITSFMDSKLDKDGREEGVWIDAQTISEKFEIDIQRAEQVKAIIDEKLRTEGIEQRV